MRATSTQPKELAKLGRIICRSATLASHTASSLSVLGRPGRCLTSRALTSYTSNSAASNR
jgi:hypothetical protein